MSQLNKILFIDIETVPQTDKLEELPEEMQKLWVIKYDLLRRKMTEKYPDEMTPAQGFESSAGIYAEFGKIICISVGFISESTTSDSFRIKSIAGKDEKLLLDEFSALVERFFTSSEHNFCGHNIKEFDIPFICRRMLVNGLTIPSALDVSGKKPWETSFIDTLELWKFGDFKNYTSLKLLTAIFGIPTPKDDIDGSQVASVYYNEKDVNRISLYCEKDVVATAQVYLRLCGEQTILPEHIEHAD